MGFFSFLLIFFFTFILFCFAWGDELHVWEPEAQKEIAHYTLTQIQPRCVIWRSGVSYQREACWVVWVRAAVVKGSTDAQWHGFRLHNEVWELSSFILLMKQGRFLYILGITLGYLFCFMMSPHQGYWWYIQIVEMCPNSSSISWGWWCCQCGSFY